MNFSRAQDGGFLAAHHHTFNVGDGSSLTLSLQGHLSRKDARRIHVFASRLRALAAGRVLTAGDESASREEVTAGWLDEAAKYAGMAKGVLNTPVGKAAAAIIPYGGIIKSAAEGAADGLAMLQKSGIAKDPRTAQRLAKLHDPRYAAEAEREVRDLREKATKGGDRRARLDQRSLQGALYRHKVRELEECQRVCRELRMALAEHRDPRAFEDFDTSGALDTPQAKRAALSLFVDQALSRSKTSPQPTFRGLRLPKARP